MRAGEEEYGGDMLTRPTSCSTRRRFPVTASPINQVVTCQLSVEVSAGDAIQISECAAL